ncbi:MULTISPECIES: hypothetical protein [unclassified Luteococcus]|uniref:hypothetical protein n=1 Tax=unclassified Luteococcus TaxID=2639923 RepID=UPI00313D2BFD
MPAPTLIRWGGLEITVAADGSLPTVSLDGRPVVRGLAVRFNPPWVHQRTELLLDEIEQHFILESDGALQARAVVRQVFDDTWSLRIQLVNLTDVELSVPPARLEFTPAWPARRWLAGAEGQISLDVAHPEGKLLTFTQLRGRSRLSEDQCWLTDLPVRLGPAGTPHAGYQVSWRADWLPDERTQAATLPSWWPERTVLLDPQEEVTLSLPDAAIEAAGIQVLQDEAVTYLTAHEGVHLAQVHAGRGTTDVELAWADDLVWCHLVPAAQGLAHRDPRALAAHEVFLLGRAQALGHLGEAPGTLVTEAVEELAAHPGPVDPLGLAAVADEVMAHGAPELVEALPELAARVPLQPGALTCILHATLASRLAGGEPKLPLPAGQVPGRAEAERAVNEAIIRTELLALRPVDEIPAQTRRLAALLGAGLPGNSVGQLTRALIWAATGNLPEHWEVERWPVPLARVREDARARLLAERCGDEVLAWLLW